MVGQDRIAGNGRIALLTSIFRFIGVGYVG